MENGNTSRKVAGGESTIAGQHNSTHELMKMVYLDEDKSWGGKVFRKEKIEDCVGVF